MLSASLIGVLCGLVASVAWAVANVFIQKAGRLSGSVLPVLWGQIVGGAALLVALPWFLPPTGEVRWGWLAVGAAASAVAYLSMFRAFSAGPVSVLSPVVSSWALISGALGVLLFDEVLTTGRVVGALLVVGGAMGIAARARKGGDEWRGPRPVVIGFGLASALGFGVMVGSLRPITEDLGPVLTILAIWAGQWLITGPFVLRRPLVPPRGAWVAIAALGLLEVIGFVALEVGVQIAPVTVVAPASSLSALITVILGRFWLNEAVGWDRGLLAVVVVVGIVVLGSA